MSSTLMSAATRLPSTTLNDSLNSLQNSSLPDIHEDEAQEHPLPQAGGGDMDEVSYDEEYVLEEDEDNEYFVEEEFVEEEIDDEDDDNSVFTEITYDSGDGANLLGDSDHNNGLLRGLGGDDSEEDGEAAFFDFEDAIHAPDVRSSARSRASRASMSSRGSQGKGIRRQVRFSNSQTRKAEEEVMKHTVQEEQARASRDAALAKQRELEAQLEEVQRAREAEAVEAAKRNQEMEQLRIQAEEREAERKAALAAERIRQVEDDNRRRLEEEEAVRRAKEEEDRRIAAQEAARQQMEEETARRLAAEEALGRAAEEKRKMEDEIKRIELELSTARKSKEEAARRHEEESDKLKTKIETKQIKAQQKLEKVTEKKTLDQQARAKVEQVAPEKTPEPEIDPSSPVGSKKEKVTGANSVAPVTPLASRADSKSIGQPSLAKKETPAVGTTTTPRRVVRRINKATGEVLSETVTPGTPSRKKVIKKVIKRVKKAPAVPTTIVADTAPAEALISPMRSSRVWSKSPGASTAGMLPTPSLDDDDDDDAPEQPKPVASKSKKTPVATTPAAPKPAAPPEPAEVPAPPAGGGSVGGVEIYSLTQLQKMSVPGLEYTQREKYMSVEDFEKVFACPYEEYQTWPKWRQTKAKRKAKLF